jgi:hypothetical protein
MAEIPPPDQVRGRLLLEVTRWMARNQRARPVPPVPLRGPEDKLGLLEDGPGQERVLPAAAGALMDEARPERVGIVMAAALAAKAIDSKAVDPVPEGSRPPRRP